MCVSICRWMHFNPRSPHGERPNGLRARRAKLDFNPRSPHGERHCKAPRLSPRGTFQSTLPARGATPRRVAGNRIVSISIHAPRTGSDARTSAAIPDVPISIHAPRTGSDQRIVILPAHRNHFNPRSPHGERPAHSNPAGASQSFQSTLPARGATRRLMSYMQSSVFQSTLPARGATLQRQHIAAGIPHFNPRSPHGERPCSARRCGLLRPISIHAPRTGSDHSRRVR